MYSIVLKWDPHSINFAHKYLDKVGGLKSRDTLPLDSSIKDGGARTNEELREEFTTVLIENKMAGCGVEKVFNSFIYRDFIVTI